MEFMLDLKNLIAKSATDAELNRVKLALNRDDRTHGPNTLPTTFRKYLIKTGTNVPERQDCCNDRTPKKVTGYTTFWTRGDYQNDSRNQNFLVAEHQQRY